MKTGMAIPQKAFTSISTNEVFFLNARKRKKITAASNPTTSVTHNQVGNQGFGKDSPVDKMCMTDADEAAFRVRNESGVATAFTTALHSLLSFAVTKGKKAAVIKSR